MRRQGKMFQMIEQDQISEEQLNKVEIINLPNKEFKVMITKMLNELRRMDQHMRSLTKS